MKQVLTMALCAVFLFSALDTPPQNAQAQIGPALIVLTVGVMASCVIIYMMRTPKSGVAHRYVLYKAHFDGNWTPIATNTFAVNGDKPLAYFSDYLTDDTANYRVEELPDVRNFATTFTAQSFVEIDWNTFFLNYSK